MMLDRAGIESRVPHAGAMCLLDAVIQWDATHITCIAAAPSATHPLARNGTVPAIAAIEYAAQATAVHGALLDNQVVPRAGMLAKLSEVELHAVRIPINGGRLNVHAELLNHAAAGCVYAFEVAGMHQRIASGRLIVAFAPPTAQ
jgi:predicted hotdog family 3-hydroxylacyl-ACP dehydratase